MAERQSQTATHIIRRKVKELLRYASELRKAAHARKVSSFSFLLRVSVIKQA